MAKGKKNIYLYFNLINLKAWRFLQKMKNDFNRKITLYTTSTHHAFVFVVKGVELSTLFYIWNIRWVFFTGLSWFIITWQPLQYILYAHLAGPITKWNQFHNSVLMFSILPLKRSKTHKSIISFQLTYLLYYVWSLKAWGMLVTSFLLFFITNLSGLVELFLFE